MACTYPPLALPTSLSPVIPPCTCRVEDVSPADSTPDGEELYAFQLLPADTQSEHAASEPLLLASSTEADKAEWMRRLETALDAVQSERAVAAAAASANAEALETQLAAASISA